MESSKIMMFPEMGSNSIDPNLLMALNNNGGFGGNNWIWILFLWLIWGWGGNGNWGVHKEDFIEVLDALKQLGCTHKDIRRSLKVLTKENTGFTFSNSDYKMSIICIGPSSDISQFVNTAIHEAKHVQSHICSYYDIPENSEDAAYLIGYLVQRMYKMFSKIIKLYV